MDTDRLKDEPAPADIPGLIAQARAAYQQNRVRECLALTKAVLLVEPGNAAAVEMQSAVRFDMQRDLSDARALIEESRNKPEAQKYRKAAEIILLKTLYLDPDSEGARTLLSSIKSVPEGQAASAPAAPVVSATPPVAPVPVASVAPPAAAAPPEPVAPPAAELAPAPAPIVESAPEIEAETEVQTEAVAAAPVSRAEAHAPAFVTQPEYKLPEPIPFTTGTTYVDKPETKKNKRSTLTIPIVIAAVAVLGGGLMLTRQHSGLVQADALPNRTGAETAPNEASALKVSYPLSSATPAASTAASTAPNAVIAANAPQTKQALATANEPPMPANKTPDPAPAANTRPATANTGAIGSLAISSAIAAEIYMGEKYLGSTPTTLQLPAGSQTIEYRHGELRSTMTHIVKANETTTALVTFDVQVQLNAKPWANVAIEGSPRIPLGQTPLSDVRLPIGTVLVFENPNFPSKSHKIDVNDKAIQMVFP